MGGIGFGPDNGPFVLRHVETRQAVPIIDELNLAVGIMNQDRANIARFGQFEGASWACRDYIDFDARFRGENRQDVIQQPGVVDARYELYAYRSRSVIGCLWNRGGTSEDR